MREDVQTKQSSKASSKDSIISKSSTNPLFCNVLLLFCRFVVKLAISHGVNEHEIQRKIAKQCAWFMPLLQTKIYIYLYNLYISYLYSSTLFHSSTNLSSTAGSGGGVGKAVNQNSFNNARTPRTRTTNCENDMVRVSESIA